MVDMRKTYGFQLANKLQSQDVYHAKVVLDELSKFHAISYAYKIVNKLPTLKSRFQCMEDPYYSVPAQKTAVDTVFKSSLKVALNALEDYFVAHPDSKQKLLDLQPVICDYFAMFLDKNGVDEEKAEALIHSQRKAYLETEPLKGIQNYMNTS